MSDPPKRTSTEPTLVIPRDALRPIARAVDRNAETLVPCPAGCVEGMVTVERRRVLLDLLDPPAELPDEDLVELDEPGAP